MKPPIADPHAPPAAPGAGLETRVFRANLWRVFFGNVLVTLIVLPPFLWYFGASLAKYPSSLGPLLLLLFMAPISGVIGAFVAPVKVNALGVQGPPAIGFVEWTQMGSCRFFWLGPPQVRVKLQGRRIALWIPLALRDTKGFAQAVEEMAPVDNPLRLFLKKRGY